MKHSIVYANPKMFAAWPANHGAWQWGDELLVGFMRGPFVKVGMHRIGRPFEKVLARSLDGGRSWSIEIPDADFECVTTPTLAPPFSLQRSIIRVCGIYDHGGDHCRDEGGFYLSHDRGKHWEGPFQFNGVTFDDGIINTSRTRTLGDLVFMSDGQESIWGTDRSFVVRHDGARFKPVGTICDDDARAVMPAVARVDGRLVAVLRRRKTGRREGWVDAFVSDDDGRNWKRTSQVGVTGSHNGNPPALIALPDDTLLATFGNRDEASLVGAVSKDRGATWQTFTIRAGESSVSVDIGYPQLFLRGDGTPICVYYWTSDSREAQHIAMTEISL
jgi:hypothetical protein